VLPGAALPVLVPRKTFVYEWGVPERAGPGPDDPSSIVWFYHSHVDERRDGVGPAQTVTADMTPDNPGIWMFHCHVSEHMQGAMVARYQVLPLR
jgi:hypothetical protein